MNQVAVHNLDIEIEVIGQQRHQRVYITGPEVPPHRHTPDRRVSNDELLIGIATDFGQYLLQRFALEYQRPLPPCLLAMQGFGVQGFDGFDDVFETGAMTGADQRPRAIITREPFRDHQFLCSRIPGDIRYDAHPAFRDDDVDDAGLYTNAEGSSNRADQAMSRIDDKRPIDLVGYIEPTSPSYTLTILAWRLKSTSTRLRVLSRIWEPSGNT